MKIQQLLIGASLALFGMFSSVYAAPVAFTTILGNFENPPTGSAGTGFATVTLDVVAHTLTINVNFSGLTGLTTITHIHCCVAAPGSAGVASQAPSFAGFPTGVTAGSYLQTFDTALSSSFNPGFITNNGGTVAGAEAALSAGLLAGRAYFNLHTSTSGGGEIRGFLAPAPDTDGDAAQDPLDNCTLVANPTQLDANADGYGNICDADINNSGTVTTADFGLLRSVLGQAAGSSATAAASDMNSSGTVTTADFGLLRARLGTAPGPSGLACAGTIPCP
jgi:hypothetical protein